MATVEPRRDNRTVATPAQNSFGTGGVYQGSAGARQTNASALQQLQTQLNSGQKPTAFTNADAQAYAGVAGKGGTANNIPTSDPYGSSSGGGGSAATSNYGNTLSSLQQQLDQLQRQGNSYDALKGGYNPGMAIVQNKQEQARQRTREDEIMRKMMSQPIASVYAPSSQAYQDAMAASLASIQGGENRVNEIVGAGQNLVGSDLNSILAALTSTTGAARDAINSGYGDAIDTLTAGRQQTRGDLTGQYGQAISGFTPFTQNAGQYMDAYANRVLQDFDPSFAQYQNSPVYQFGLQEGNNGIINSMAARGSLQSGGTLKALQKYGSDYASQNYMDYTNNRISQAQQLAQMGYGAQQGQSALMAQLGDQLANYNFNYDTGISGTQVGQANALGSLEQQYGMNQQTAYQNRSTLNTQLAMAQAEAASAAAAARANTQFQGITGAGSGFQTLKAGV